VFKGGTCLSKIHSSFFRLSEDLDFALSTPTDATRGQRKRRIAGFKEHFSAFPTGQSCFRIDEPLRGFNTSVQYGARLAYMSVISGEDEFIEIEVSVREPVVEPHDSLPARTLLLDPFRGTPAVAPFETSVLTLREAYAEKLRAALSRREPAIRDFFDLDHAVAAGQLNLTDSQLIALLKTKLSVPSNDAIDMSAEKLEALRAQVETQLRPVLREADLASFDVQRAFKRVALVAHLLAD
jgi:predicted nucleotidyltransferase component of viral defense system